MAGDSMRICGRHEGGRKKWREKEGAMGWAQWLTSVILATQEAEIRRIRVRSQPWQKYTSQKGGVGGAGEVAQGVGPEFKPQYHTHT
jgi:hypothetical protein